MRELAVFLAGVGAMAVAGAFLFACFMHRRRQAEERTRLAKERVHRSQRRAETARLAGGLIHEIKNPLNTLGMNLQLLAEDWDEPKTQKERRALKRIQRLQSETSRLAGILEEFMGFVRERQFVPTPCDVNQLVDDVVTFVRPELAAKDIEIRTSYGDAPRCILDVNLFKQALLNLFLNAEEALANSASREIMVRTTAENEHARIDIIDTGKGIVSEDMARIFEAFYSTRIGGTGLGLPTTRRIIEEHGGSIAVHSDHGHGTCFTLLLPPYIREANDVGVDARVTGDDGALADSGETQ